MVESTVVPGHGPRPGIPATSTLASPSLLSASRTLRQQAPAQLRAVRLSNGGRRHARVSSASAGGNPGAGGGKGGLSVSGAGSAELLHQHRGGGGRHDEAGRTTPRALLSAHASIEELREELLRSQARKGLHTDAGTGIQPELLSAMHAFSVGSAVSHLPCHDGSLAHRAGVPHDEWHCVVW